MATLAPYVFWQEMDNNGAPLNGGLVYTYEAGTSTPKATYTDAGGLTANANPVVLDSAGRASIWLGDGGYKFIIKTSAGVTVDTRDNIGGDTSTAYGGNTQEISTNTTINTTYQNSALIATAALTLSLLAVADADEGFYFSIFALGGDVTIDPDTSETINNASTLTIPQGGSALVITDGDEWWAFFSGVTASGSNTFTGTNTFTGKVLTPDDGELTIASDAVTVTGVYHSIDTQADAATDDLATINGGADGQLLVIGIENNSRNVVLTTAGNIVTPDGFNILLDTTSETALLQYDGALSKWRVISKFLREQINRQVFTGSGTFTTGADITTDTVFKIIGTGGGGGGGGASGSTNACASGGGAGGTFIKWVTGLTPSTGYTVTIGAAGAAGSNSGGNGGAGGDTTIVIGATTYTGSGGLGGTGSTNTNALFITPGVAGSGATNGDQNITGGSSHHGISLQSAADSVMGGAGGASFWGGGGAGGQQANGNAGVAFGSGGGGRGSTSSSGTGGAGAPGVLTIEWLA